MGTINFSDFLHHSRMDKWKIAISCASFPTGRNGVCVIFLSGSDEGQGSENDEMLSKVVEASSDQLSSQNNGDVLPFRVSSGKQKLKTERTKPLYTSTSQRAILFRSQTMSSVHHWVQTMLY